MSNYINEIEEMLSRYKEKEYRAKNIDKIKKKKYFNNLLKRFYENYKDLQKKKI